MTVREVKEKFPLAEVFELLPERKYMVKLPKGCTREQAIEARDALEESGVNCFVITGDVKVFDI